jgi:hypothetical protein
MRIPAASAPSTTVTFASAFRTGWSIARPGYVDREPKERAADSTQRPTLRHWVFVSAELADNDHGSEDFDHRVEREPGQGHRTSGERGADQEPDLDRVPAERRVLELQTAPQQPPT